MKIMRVIGFAMLWLLLLAGATEAIVRTNPISHPPKVRRTVPGQVLESLETTTLATSSAEFTSAEVLPDKRLVAIDSAAIVSLLSKGRTGGRYESSTIGTLPALALGADSEGQRLLVSCAWAGTEVFDTSGAGAPVPLVVVPPGSSSRSVAVDSDVAYVADWTSGMQLIGLEGSSARVLGFFDTPGHAYDVAIAGGRAYIADFEGGVRVVDVTTPDSPVAAGAWQMMPAATGVAVQGNYVYVADEQRGLFVVDIRRPAAPRVVAEIKMEVSASDVEVTPTRVIVTDRAGGLSLFDITDPTAPRALGRTQIAGKKVEIEVDGNKVYLAAGRLLVAEVPQ